MWSEKGFASSLVVAVLGLAAFGAGDPSPQGGTWGIFFGDPGRSGTHTTTLGMSYIDSNGVKREKTISAPVDLTAADTPDTKKGKAQTALNSALSSPANMVGGQPLAMTGGTGNGMTITPSPNNPSPGGFSNAKIESLDTQDNKTGEDDQVVRPKKKALAQVSPEGELLGRTGDGDPSVFFITTDLGEISVQLSGSMSRLELLNALGAGLLAQDPSMSVWVDNDRLVLSVLLLDGDKGIQTIGAGSTDEGLTAVCKVMITESEWEAHHDAQGGALAQVSAEGELLGRTRDGDPSVFFITTDLGEISVQLTGSMSRLELLRALEAGLLAQDPGLPVWVDTDRLVLYVLLQDDGKGIQSIGAGSTDEGLHAVCSVTISE